MYFIEIDIRIGNRIVTKVLHDPHSNDSVLYKGKITRMLNAVNDFRFEMLYSHPLFKEEIRPYAAMVRVKDNQNKIIFRGRVIDYSQKMGNNGQIIKEFVVECELAFLLDSVQRVREFSGHTLITTGEYVRRLIRRHNDRVEDEKRIDVVNVNGVDYDPDLPEVSPFPLPICDVCQVTPRENCRDCARLRVDRHHITYASTFKNITDNLLDEFGGYVWLDYRMSADGRSEQRVLYYEQREDVFWKPGNMPIKLAENIENIKSEQLSSQTLTRLVPLGIELNTPENAIRRLVAVGLIDNDTVNPGEYGQNVHWWLQNFNRLDPWMFQLLINLSRLNYIPCDGVGCENPECKHGVYVPALFDSAINLTNQNNIRNSAAFERSIRIFNRENVRAVNNVDYWLLGSGRANIHPPDDIFQGLNQEQRTFLMRLRWLVRKAERALNICHPRFTGSDELNARLNLGNPNWIEVDIEPALNRLHYAGIILTQDHWLNIFDNRFRNTSPWTGQLLLSLSVLNYDPGEVEVARGEIDGGPAIDLIVATRLEEWHAGIDKLASVGAIHNPEHWKERYFSRDIVALLWITGRSVNLRNPRSPYAMSARNLFGTIVEKVVTWDDITCCDELWRKGVMWIRNRALANSITVSALDLSHLDIGYEQFKVGNTYRAEHELLGINDRYRLIQQSIDVIDPLKSNLTFGDRQIALSRTSSRAR